MDTIREAKKELQALIIGNEFVTSIATRFRQNGDYIEVGVSDARYIPEIQAHLLNNTWHGYSVEIIVEPPSEPLNS